MAPRPRESIGEFALRLKSALKRGETEIRFGGNHHTHAVCVDEGQLKLKRLELSMEAADAFRQEHGYFSPENAEDLSAPGLVIAESEGVEGLMPTIEKLGMLL